MNRDHWREYHARWARLSPPLRPSDGVVSAVRALVAERPGPSLLLGVTPELRDAAADVTAVDRSEAMIAAVWPGDSASRRAVVGDWRALPVESGRFATIVGDGSLNVVSHADDAARLWDEASRVVRPGGRAVFRVFLRPEAPESVPDVLRAAMAGEIGSFHSFKWRLAMARVAELGTPDIAVAEILGAFERTIVDRAELVRRTGWLAADVDTIDVYRGSSEVYCFPTEDELREIVDVRFGPTRLLAVPGYELAERCPLLVAERLG